MTPPSAACRRAAIAGAAPAPAAASPNPHTASGAGAPVGKSRPDSSSVGTRTSTPALSDLDHARDRSAGTGGDVVVDRDDVAHVAQGVTQLLERDHLHVAADGPFRHRVEPLVRGLPGEPVQDAGLGGDDEI